ncbi:hypothetical protein J437_LFUL013255 [Ladona fulva]|uniref:Amino acid transporter transmembrane domain-containing protein n=1 Tax=Ladona fulva TaxID=123851 RepID=A0A8K0P1X7_LADFU|nr:hypothetical protein J437_LFUL013255 [Ladona fulva]
MENNMSTPSDFGGYSGVLNRAMFVIVTMYVVLGFSGYLKYGENVLGSVTLNLPTDEAGNVLPVMKGAKNEGKMLFFQTGAGGKGNVCRGHIHHVCLAMLRSTGNHLEGVPLEENPEEESEAEDLPGIRREDCHRGGHLPARGGSSTPGAIHLPLWCLVFVCSRTCVPSPHRDMRSVEGPRPRRPQATPRDVRFPRAGPVQVEDDQRVGHHGLRTVRTDRGLVHRAQGHSAVIPVRTTILMSSSCLFTVSVATTMGLLTRRNS